MRISKRDPAELTNAQILSEWDRMHKADLEMCDVFIDAGLGHLRPSDMRKDPSTHPSIPRRLAILDRSTALFTEAVIRIGPRHSRVSLRDLSYNMPKGYRRRPR